MGIAFQKNETSSLIRLDGEIDISSAAELKASLVEALGRGMELRVALDQGTGLDVTAVQLLWAAGRAAKGAGLPYALAGSAPEAALAALRQAGFEQFPVPADAGQLGACQHHE